MVTESWRLAIFANPSADKPTVSCEFASHADLRRELIFVHGLDRTYVEHGLMIVTSDEARFAPSGAMFEYCKSRDEAGGARIVWIARVTLIRRGNSK